MEIKYNIWLEREGQVLFGKGREELLEAVEELHTLSAAARKLNMSYRAAWGRLRASEERLGFNLIEKSDTHKGMQLTAEGKELLETFKKLRHETRLFLDKAGQRLSLLQEITPG